MKLLNISKTYHNRNNDVQALKNINLTFSNQGMTFIVGESGCGKTTLLNIIAGHDQNFEGILEKDGKVESIEQEIMLLENLSIYDNLLLVCDDKEKVNELLEHFQLNEKYKKVKKLSVGEKKRVQIIRSLLTQASYLICDEPTASLDHENGRSVMEMLKEISKNIGVIVVTHDIAIVEQYKDRVIRMGKGCILKDEPYTMKEHRIEDHEEKRSPNKQFKFLIKMMKSRWQETLFRYILLFFTVLAAYVLIFLFPSLHTSMSGRSNWLNGKNVIITEPVDQTTTYKNRIFDPIHLDTGESFVYYDVYKKEDAYLVYDNMKGILGFNLGWDEYNFNANSPENSFFPMTNIDGLRKEVELFTKDEKEGGASAYHFYPDIVDSLAEYDRMYPNESFPKDEYIFPDYSHFFGINTYYGIPQTKEVALDNLGFLVTPYQLFPNVKMDLMYGKMPEKKNEILVSKSVAERLIKIYQLPSLEALVRRETCFRFRESHTEFYEDSYRFKEEVGFASYPYTICGITYMYCELEDQVFFMDGGFEQPFIEEYGVRPEIASYQYLNFLINPNLDGKEVAKNLDRILESKDSRFTVYGDIETRIEQYQDPLNMIVFVGFALLVLLTIYLMMQFLLNRRICKENKILNRYRYNSFILQIVQILLLMVGIMLAQVASLSYVCDWFNQLAHLAGFANIVEYSMAQYILSLSIATIIVVLLEGSIYIIRTKTHA